MRKHTKRSKQRLFDKCITALCPHIITEDKIICNEEEFTISVNLSNVSVTKLFAIIDTIHSCQYYYKIDKDNSVISSDILVLRFYSPIYNKLYPNKIKED